MKKMIGIFCIAVALCITLCGCNKNLSMGNLSFHHAHFSDGLISHCVEVTSWHDDDMGCEIHTPNGGIFLSEGTYQLFETATICPYCN